ncbi:hypothetical protein L0P06_11075, partial [Amedibacillus dolichus]|uniref:hypothetical protein n=1 Tax=Amedibacillus dolichus TaxID=31971 RepID=UPI001EDA1476
LISQYSEILLTMSLAVFAVFIFFVIRRIFQISQFLKEDYVLLELTPPAITEKTAYTTKQLFSVIHNLGEHRTLFDLLLGRKKVFS